MTRRLRALNRVVGAVVGFALLVAGLAAIAWYRGDLARWWPRTPDRLDVAGVQPPAGGWWPWALVIGGVVVGVLALWWLAAHLRTTRIGSFRLAGSAAQGTLTLNAGSAVDHLGTLVRRLPRVVGYRATLVRERDRPVLSARVRITPDADVAEIADRLATLTAEFARAASIPDLGVRVRLQVVRKAGRPRREVE